MDKEPDTTGSDLPPAPGPDSWSSAEAADWDPDDGTPPGDGDEA